MDTLDSDLGKRIHFSVIKSACALTNMLNEMLKKKLELKRLTKAATLLQKSGFSSPQVFSLIEDICIRNQKPDGGWVSVVDTMWNVAFLEELDYKKNKDSIKAGKNYLLKQQTSDFLWGRSVRDFSRIPVSGLMLYLFKDFATSERLYSLLRLWHKERNSLTYKASYTLLALRENNYTAFDHSLEDTENWLIENQKEDGGFSPWKSHPVSSDTYCTSIALLGMLTLKGAHNIPIKNAVDWLLRFQLPSGIWPFHEIDDGCAWALYALSKTMDKLR